MKRKKTAHQRTRFVSFGVCTLWMVSWNWIPNIVSIVGRTLAWFPFVQKKQVRDEIKRIRHETRIQTKFHDKKRDTMGIALQYTIIITSIAERPWSTWISFSLGIIIAWCSYFCVARIKTVQLTICLHRSKTQTQKEMRSRSAQCSPEDEKVEKSQWLYAKWAVCMRLVFSLLEKHAVQRIMWKITKWKCKWWSPQGSFSALRKVVRTELNACVIWCIISFYCFLWCATFIFLRLIFLIGFFCLLKKRLAVIFEHLRKIKP